MHCKTLRWGNERMINMVMYYSQYIKENHTSSDSTYGWDYQLSLYMSVCVLLWMCTYQCWWMKDVVPLCINEDGGGDECICTISKNECEHCKWAYTCVYTCVWMYVCYLTLLIVFHSSLFVCMYICDEYEKCSTTICFKSVRATSTAFGTLILKNTHAYNMIQ